MSLYPSASSSRRTAAPVGITEFEILKASHKFLREEDEKPTTWDDKLAGKYYSSLYREFAVCDLKHYKSGNFALRWRTEEEVLSGAGETTCGNTRCDHHFAPRFQDDTEPKVGLTTLELPFAYIEHGEGKSALVKVVLCRKCVKKLMWKRDKEKERDAPPAQPDVEIKVESAGEEEVLQKKRSRNDDEDRTGRSSRRRRNSRSRSPRERRHKSKRSP